MASTIWKFSAPVRDDLVILMPKGSKILSVQKQEGHPQIWALVPDYEAEMEPREFAWYGTGHPLPDDPGLFVGTVVGAALVFHLFETTSGDVL